MEGENMNKAIIPGDKESRIITLNPGRFTEYGRYMYKDYMPMAGAASFSDYLENKVLDHIFNDGTYSVPTASLGLWTSALTDASTGATTGEAAYTTYARVTIAAADMSAAA